MLTVLPSSDASGVTLYASPSTGGNDDWRNKCFEDICPIMLAPFHEILEDILAECARNGERFSDKLQRERMEWAEDDAQIVKLKETGNAAFEQGDYRTAFIIYSACIYRSPHEGRYSLNRAAAALSASLVTEQRSTS